MMCISKVGDQISFPTVSFVIKNIDTKKFSFDIYIEGHAKYALDLQLPTQNKS